MDGKICTERNAPIDILKYICAFLVICVHVNFEGRYYAEPLMRMAVPVFFMITGWFYSDEKERRRKQFLKILRIYLFSGLIYFLWWALDCAAEGLSIAAELPAQITPGNIVKLLLFNQTMFGRHLWYLTALLYVLAIAALLGENGRRKAVFLIPVLLAGAMALGAYSPLYMGWKLDFMYGRNFLFTGLPCFLLGEHLRRVRHRLRLSPPVLLVLLGIFFVLSLKEKIYLHNRTGYDNAEMYISTMLMAVSAFLLATGAGSPRNAAMKEIARWGRDYTLGIYILQAMVIDIMQRVLERPFLKACSAAKVHYYTAPLVILLFTTALTALLKAAQRRAKAPIHE